MSIYLYLYIHSPWLPPPVSPRGGIVECLRPRLRDLLAEVWLVAHAELWPVCTRMYLVVRNEAVEFTEGISEVWFREPFPRWGFSQI